jgi:predicted extracellular nuclease
MFERDNINNKEFYDNLIKLKFTYLNKMENQAGYIRLFDEIDFIDGVFYKKNNNYYITPIDKIKIKPVIKRKKQEEPTKDELKISFFNVENLFVKQSKKHYFENKAQIDFKLKKVAKAIYSNKPDLIALSELGNLTKEKYAIKKLVLELNKMEGKNKYSFFYDEKFNPKDRFYLAYIYDLKKFKPLDKPIASKEYSSITASFKNLKNGEKFVFSALHLRSPICDFNDISKGYGCFEELRQDQINQAFQNIKKITQKQNIKNILISGDFNSIINSKTYDYVKNKGFIDLLSAFEKQELLFSKFFNNSKVGLIDHFFANKTFFEKVKRAKIEHINSIEPQANNYKSLEDISLYRSSDHDIVSIFIKD